MASEITASLNQISPQEIFSEGYELSDQSLIPNTNIISTFVPFEDIVELWFYDLNNNFIGGVDEFIDYELVPSSKEELNDGNASILNLEPIKDAENLGFDVGKIKSIYNFIRYELSSSSSKKYYISEISTDRTEIRLKSNFISNEEILATYSQFKELLDSSEYFDEFYLNFGDNQYQIGINILLDTTQDQYSILVKLYSALSPEFDLKDEVSVVTKTAESVAYAIDFPLILDLPLDITFIQGPNTNLNINDFVNNSTELKSKSELLNTESSASKDNLSYELNQNGVTITPNYSYDTFNEFVNFSSAKKRIENFIEKLTQIQSYEDDIISLTAITGSTSQSFSVSSSIASAYTNIENLIKNFDGYEYYLYYNTGSYSYPKSGSSFPFTPIDVTDVSASIWLGSDVEGSQYYGGILLSASLYDNNNQNWLYYTIPEFIRDNNNNNQYLEFTNMVGQHFDEIWLYTKAVSAKLNTTSDLNSGVPLELADDVISSLGYQGFGNNYNNQDNYIGLTGEDNGSYVPPTGSELITNYIAVNGGSVVNYWNINYSFLNYVEQLLDPGYPYAIDRVSKEIFKRLYHNMSYLVKKKGTIAGLRQLINIWGIPNTILRINEFGGKNKDNTDDYDLWYDRYSYAFTPVSTQYIASASVVFPWMPLNRNYVSSSDYIVPDSFQFRFKTTGYPSSQYAGDFFTQSLAVKKSDGDDTSTDFDFGISLYYEPVATGSYSGSTSSEYQNWGTMKFYISGAAADGGVAESGEIYLPFFNKGWWTVMLQRDQHVSASDNNVATTYTLYAKNNIYNGWDGNQIGFEGSASIVSNISTSVNEAWNKFGTGSADGIYLGGFVSGSNVGGITLNESGKIFSGSLQEFRYYGNPIPETVFNDFVMNPESIEGINITGSLSSFDIVNFRAPLGNELESIFTSSFSSSYTESMVSMHPAVSGEANLLITSSFINPETGVTSSTYDVIYYENSTLRTFSKTNTEVYFLDQPSVGVRNRVSNKIEIDDAQDYGTTLSSLRSIQQDYQISRSYTEDINSLEVAFSPQDEVNDDIIQSFGYGVVSDALADPRFLSESVNYYPQLRKSAEYYFEKYTKGNVYDYLRLIKYFDNSIFSAIKSYVPARTSVSTGIVIKQHLLERNRARPVQLSEVTQIAVTPSGGLNTPIVLENLELTSSIGIGSFDGGAGGSVNQFNLPSGLLRLQDNNVSSTYTLTSGVPTTAFTNPDYSFIDTRTTFLEVSQSIVDAGYGFPNPTDGVFTNITDYDFTGDVQFSIFNQSVSSANITINIIEVGKGTVASVTNNFPASSTTYARGGEFNKFTIKAKTAYYVTMTSDATVTVRRLQFGFEGHPLSFRTGQVYNNDKATVLGLVVDIDQREEEFYNGEYSGSEYAVTTQSLFDNPFTEYSATETVYNTNVNNMNTILSYDQLGNPVHIYLSASAAGDLTQTQLTAEISLLKTWNDMSPGTASIVHITPHPSDNKFWYIEGIVVSSNTYTGGGIWTSINDNTFNGLNSSFPDSDDAIGTWWSDVNSWSETPFMYFPIPNPTSGTIDAAGDASSPFPNGTLMPWLQITSMGLKYRSSLGNTNGRSWLFTIPTSPTSTATPNTSRPVVGTTSLNWTTQGYTTTHFKYNDTVDAPLLYASQSAPVSQSILNLIPAPLWLTSSADNNVWTPYSLVINDTDVNGNYNYATLINDPSFTIELSQSKTPFNSTSYIFSKDNLSNYNLTYNSANSTHKWQFSQFYDDWANGQTSKVGSVASNLISFDPYLDPIAINFENSDYYATLNNFNDNRQNSYIMNLEYDNGIATPSNISLVKARTAEKTQTPDSNYSSRKVTIPRYLGSKLQSANYNFYTPTTSTTGVSASFINGETGSWAGDISYGKTAVIDKNPIYFAHFKSSKENYELWNTYTFRLDALIQVPFEDVRGTNFEPATLKLDGSNDKLAEVVSTFEKNRGAIVTYNKGKFNKVDYTSLKVGDSPILQGGLEYNLLIGNEVSDVNYLPTCSFISASWGGFFQGTSYKFEPYVTLTKLSGGNEGSDHFLSTGSGYLKLEGGGIMVSSSYEPSSNKIVQQKGPGLGMLHTLNIAISTSRQMTYNTSSDSLGALGMPRSGSTLKPLNPLNPSNYYTFSPLSDSEMENYESFNIPFIIKRGDEIRVTWNQSTGSLPSYDSQDFTVTRVKVSGSGVANGSDYETVIRTGGVLDSTTTGILHSSIWNIIEVTPDPSSFGIPNGEIFNFTIRRRVEADDRVIVFQSPPSGSKGFKSISGQGYLIPNDLTPTQKRNVQTMIGQLQSKNLFLDSVDVEATSSI